MKRFKTHILPYLILFLLPASILFSQANGEKIYYGVEIDGVLCGYSEMSISPGEKNGKKITLLEQKIIIKQSILGADVDAKIELKYHIDPETGNYFYCDSDILIGTTTPGCFLTGPKNRKGKVGILESGKKLQTS